MKFRKKSDKVSESDMTPMIDCVFQLIAFFMVLVNFTEVDQNQAINLPQSTLAKPPEEPPDCPITLQLTRAGTVFLAGQEMVIPALAADLKLEANTLKARGKNPRATPVIIRADADAKTGQVQHLISVCQEEGFEKFALRAKYIQPK